MRTLDRYIIRSFLFSAFLCFVVLMSLRVVIDLFVNIDEFAKLGMSFGDTMIFMGSYYGYQSLAYFTELGGVILVAGAAFTLARMNHTNELTAMLASGVSLYRVVWPILIAAMLLCGLIIADRELFIPPVADKLVRERDWVPQANSFPIWLIDDEKGAIWYSPEFKPFEERMRDPVVNVRDSQRLEVARVCGDEARPGSYNGQKGWLITGAVIRPPDATSQLWLRPPKSDEIFTSLSPKAVEQMLPADNTATKLSLVDPEYGNMLTEGLAHIDRVNKQIVLIRPTFTFAVNGVHLGTILAEYAILNPGKGRESCWTLQEGRLFFPSELTAKDLVLRRAKRWQAYLSVRQLAGLLRMKSAADRNLQMLIQARVTDPINNLVMLLIGLPFILSRERNIKASASLCLLMVGTFYVFIYICRYMDLPPVLAAWLPILLFGPIAAVMLDAVKT